MESLLASQDNDELLPMVNYKLVGKTTSYIVRRDEATFFSSVVEAGPNSVRVATFNVNSDNFIDLNSLHFSFEVVNKVADKALRSLAPTAHCLFDPGIP